MKRIYTGIALALTLLLLGGCSALPQPGPDDGGEVLAMVTEHFSTDASILCGELEMSASITRSPESCTVVYSQPPSLEGMEVVFGRDTVDVHYKDLSFSYDPSGYPTGAAARLTVDAVGAVLKKEGITTRRQEDMVVAEGRIPAGTFTAFLDGETGRLIKLSLPDAQLEIAFENFTFFD